MTMPSDNTSKTVKPTKSIALPTIRLRVNDLRIEHGYKFNMDLWKKLHNMGIEISYAQLTRIINNQADMLDKRLLAAFTVIFQCKVQDLFN